MAQSSNSNAVFVIYECMLCELNACVEPLTGTSNQMKAANYKLHAGMASPKPSFRAPWKIGDAVVGRGNAGWTTSKRDIRAHASTAHKDLLQKRLEEDLF